MRCPICGAEARSVRELRQCPDHSGRPVCARHCREECIYWYNSIHCGGCQYRRWHTWTNPEQTQQWVEKIIGNLSVISARQKAEIAARKEEQA